MKQFMLNLTTVVVEGDDKIGCCSHCSANKWSSYSARATFTVGLSSQSAGS